MSDTASALLFLQQIEFCQVASAAALFYDYLLALGPEVDLIWTKKWNLVTLLYAIVRYLSFFLILDTALYTGNVNWSAKRFFGVSDYPCNQDQTTLPNSRCLALYQCRMWGLYVFRIAMDIIMMKRIRALSLAPNRFLNKPKLISVIMTIAFVLKYALAITLLFLAIGAGSHLSSIEAEISGVFVCGTMIPREDFLMASQIPTLCFEILLFILAFGYFAADVWENYRRSESWKVNDLVKILVRDSTVYFAINLAAPAMNVGNWQVDAPNAYLAVSMALQAFIPYCFAPRLVINVKQYENRVHMSGFGGDLPLRNFNFEEGHQPRDGISLQTRDGFA